MANLWPDAADTQTLLDRARSGDADAVDQLLARHRPALRRAVDLRLDPALAGRLDASDIVQEAFLVASERLKSYLADGSMPFHLWLRRIALDRMIDAHRRHRGAGRRSVDRERRLEKRRDLGASSGELIAELEASGLTPVAAALRREMADRVLEAMEQLPEKDRELLLMRHFEQLSNREVARALGIGDAACGMRYLRALRRLRDILEQSE
ncbi:MAG TPA: sigma-70 family RNA polymerase sigma factor [Planctomycetota bacterium]|nr:sigma-70 family RNA polymerase sigma factor [Planctomycetota bacterium]